LRWIKHTAVLALIAAATWSPETVKQIVAERAEAYGASPALVLSVAACETGGSFSPERVGSNGERGIGQWLPGRGNHWDRTPAWRVWQIDIVHEYVQRGPVEEVVWLDIDQLAWSLSPEAEKVYPDNWRGWTCAA
jgi:hypothetical protein